MFLILALYIFILILIDRYAPKYPKMIKLKPTLFYMLYIFFGIRLFKWVLESVERPYMTLIFSIITAGAITTLYSLCVMATRNERDR